MLTVPHGAALSERNHATGRVLPAFYLYAVSVIYCMALTRGNFLQAALLSGWLAFFNERSQIFKSSTEVVAIAYCIYRQSNLYRNCSVSIKIPPARRVEKIRLQWLIIFVRNFTHIFGVEIYAKPQSFIHLFLNLTKLCYNIGDHPTFLVFFLQHIYYKPLLFDNKHSVKYTMLEYRVSEIANKI